MLQRLVRIPGLKIVVALPTGGVARDLPDHSQNLLNTLRNIAPKDRLLVVEGIGEKQSIETAMRFINGAVPTSLNRRTSKSSRRIPMLLSLAS